MEMISLAEFSMVMKTCITLMHKGLPQLWCFVIKTWLPLVIYNAAALKNKHYLEKGPAKNEGAVKREWVTVCN